MDIVRTESARSDRYRQAPLRSLKSASWPGSSGYGSAIIGQLSCILFRGGGSTAVLYIGWAGSYQRIYDLFPTVRTLLGTMLGLRLARVLARVITRGKLSTDTAAGRSTCRSFRSFNENETGGRETSWIRRG